MQLHTYEQMHTKQDNEESAVPSLGSWHVCHSSLVGRAQGGNHHKPAFIQRFPGYALLSSRPAVSLQPLPAFLPLSKTFSCRGPRSPQLTPLQYRGPARKETGNNLQRVEKGPQLLSTQEKLARVSNPEV